MIEEAIIENSNCKLYEIVWKEADEWTHMLYSRSHQWKLWIQLTNDSKKRESEHRLIHWMLQWQWVCLCGKGWGKSHNNRWHCYETCSTLFVLCVCVLRQTGTIQRTPTSISKTHTISQMLFFPSFLHLYAIRVHFNIFFKFIHIRYFSYIIICSQYFSQNEYKILMPFIHFNLLVFE